MQRVAQRRDVALGVAERARDGVLERRSSSR
jgi:hypothetical protein